MKKNATQAQRRAVMQNLASVPDRESVELNGRIVSRSKLIRWEKEMKKGSLSVSSSGPNSPAIQDGEPQGGEPRPLPTQAREQSPSSISGRQLFLDHHHRPWAFVDVPGSPKLSRLFTALEVHCANDITPLSLFDFPGADIIPESAHYHEYPRGRVTGYDSDGGSDNSAAGAPYVFPPRSQSPQDQIFYSNYGGGLASPFGSRLQSPSLFYELYPFPQSDEVSSQAVVKSEAPFSAVQFSVAELQARVAQHLTALAQLQITFAKNHPTTVDSMETLAKSYCQLGEHVQAEKWWRQVADAKHSTQGPRALSTLAAWIMVVRALDDQGTRFEEAEELHKQIFARIIQAFSADHELALEAMFRQALRLNNKKQFEKAEALYRQLLQLRLSIQGPRDPATIKAMSILARSMSNSEGSDRWQYLHLARSAMQLQERVGLAYKTEASFDVVNDLLYVLRLGQQYQESSNLGEVVLSKVTPILGDKHPETLRYMCELGASYRQQGRLMESVSIFQTVISKQASDVHVLDAVWRIYELSEGLLGLGRVSEAIPLLEEIFRNDIREHGWMNLEPKEGCEDLGKCYLQEGRYMDAMELYEEYIRMIKKSHGDDHPWIKDFQDLIDQISQPSSFRGNAHSQILGA
jgi:tetratricopeptide (TPR) repeat protein